MRRKSSAGAAIFTNGKDCMPKSKCSCMATETKGVPLEEIVGLWKQHWYWKRFTDGEHRALTDAELAAVPPPAQTLGSPNPKSVPMPAPPAASNGTSPDCYYTI